MNVTNILRFSENIERVQPAAAPQPASSKAASQAISYLPVSTGGVSPAADQASFSSVSGLIADTLAVSDVRWDRIASLQQAIADGSYGVSSTDVAGGLLSYLLP